MAPARAYRTLALGLALAALPVGRAVEAGPYQEGQDIEITGTVTDESGRAMEGVTVVLEASRRAWRFRALNLEEKGRTVVDSARRKAVTGPGGRFTIPWRWHDYYNVFALVAGRTVKTAEGEKLLELERIDLSRRIRQGSPVVTTFILPAAGASRPAGATPPAAETPRPEASETRSREVSRRFAEAVRSDDERRVFDSHGEPDRVEVFDHPERQEVTWWYFRLGKAYRFADGALVQVVPFDPVEPF